MRFILGMALCALFMMGGVVIWSAVSATLAGLDSSRAAYWQEQGK